MHGLSAKIFAMTCEISCPVCLSVDLLKDTEQVENFDLLHCNACGLEFSRSMRYSSAYYEELFYSQDYNLSSVSGLTREAFLRQGSKLAKDQRWQPYKLALDWIEGNFKNGSTILDIGCGMGYFLAALEAKGFRGIGVEVSSKVVSLLQAKGFQVYLGPLENTVLGNTAIDLVVLFGVIEHVADPVKLLKEIHHRFPKSMLLVSIPSPKRWDFKIGAPNYWDYPPNHLTPAWSEKSLEIAFKRSAYCLKQWFFPMIPGDEIWFVFLEKIFFKIGLRKKGYWVGLTSDAFESRSPAKNIIKLFYREFEKLNLTIRCFLRPVTNAIGHRLESQGYSGLSAFAIAEPL